MALDSRQKRAGAIGVSLPWRGMLPAADGEVGAADRAMAAGYYPGFFVVVWEPEAEEGPLVARIVAPSTTAFETITVGATSVGLTEAAIAGKSRALITVETNPVRVRFDGEDPTAAVGHAFAAGTIIELNGAVALGNFRAIRTGSSATLSCSYGT